VVVLAAGVLVIAVDLELPGLLSNCTAGAAPGRTYVTKTASFDAKLLTHLVPFVCIFFKFIFPKEEEMSRARTWGKDRPEDADEEGETTEGDDTICDAPLALLCRSILTSHIAKRTAGGRKTGRD